MSLPTVSIIINNFNYARYLEVCIQSALNQTYPAIEIIVVDDGSTDGSRELLERYANQARIVLRENGGQAAAFNSGFAHSSGQLVSFLDADDKLFPHAIATVVMHWKQEYAKLHFPLRILDSDDRATPLLMPRLPVSGGDDVKRSFLETGRYISSPTSGNVFNREFLRQVLPIPEAAWAKTADGYLNNCAPFYGTIGALHEPLAFYRVHGESMSSVISKGKLNLATAKQLMENGLCEKRLIQEMARAHNVTVSPHIVTSHWLYLKLRITIEKERCRRRALGISRDLFGFGGLMATSIWRSRELAPFKKLQHLCWTLWMVVMPWPFCQRVIRYAFETAPSATLSVTLRQL